MGEGERVRVGFVTLVTRIVAVATLYFLGAKLGLQLAFENQNVTAVWPPTGIAVAALMLWGTRMWPAIAIGAFTANLANGAMPPMAAAIAVGNTAGPVLATIVLRRLGVRSSLDRVRDVIILFAVGVVAMTVSASFGTAALWMNDALAGETVASLWLLWWIGDAFGVVLFAPFLMLLARPASPHLVRDRPIEALALLTVAAAVTYAVFSVEHPIAFVIAVPIVWAALRFEQPGTAFVVVVVALIAIAKTVTGDGQFSFMDPDENIAMLQVFNGSMAFASLALAAVMHERTQAQQALRHGEERFRQAFDRATDLLCIHDAYGRLTYVNDAAERITGYSKQRLLSMTIEELVAPESVGTLRRTIERQQRGEVGTATYEAEVVGTSGHRASLEVTSTPVGPPEGMTFQLVGRDITSRRAAEEEVRRRSLMDDLTGLPNRTLLRERLDYAIAIARRDGSRVALVVLDIDRLKEVNDTFGHETGDDILRRFAARLRKSFRDPDTVARIGGDDFAILAPSIATGRPPEVIAEQLRAQLEAPFEVDGRAVILKASAGLALFPDHADDIDQLIRRADLAMHDAKREGGGRHTVYHRELDSVAMRRYTVEGELAAAVEQGGFALHYQPKIEVATMRTVAVECLLRWTHDRLGPVPPRELIPIAIEANLMERITDWVLHQAVSQCAMWNEAGLDLSVCVNLARSDLHLGTVERISSALSSRSLDPARLIVEVNESDVSVEGLHLPLEKFAAVGVRIGIDDFGTGRSSMTHLSRLPLHELKIDRSFIGDIGRSGRDHPIIRSMAELARNLGLSAVAEGVETREAWTVVEHLGFDAAQGNLICPPLPADELESWLRTPAWSSRVR